MTNATPTPGPTVALVHGAFADSSGWSGVIEGLMAAGVPVVSISNPLRGIAEDAADVASALGQIPGPVLAVGHSYGGAVITNAAAKPGNVIGLVYVSAFAPDEGEVILDIEGGSTDSVLDTALVPAQYPTASGGTETEFYINPQKFHDVFAADVSPELAAVMAATKPPASPLGFPEKNTPPACKTLPPSADGSTGDLASGWDVVRAMPIRAGSTIT